MNATGQTTLARDVIGKPVQRAVPTQPVLIRPLPDKPLQFEDLDALARHVHQVRAQNGGELRGLRVGPMLSCSYPGYDTFPGFYLYAIDPDTQAETWIGCAAVQAETPDKLEAAIRRAEPARRAA